jgi:nucleoid-associated protein YgaU
MPRDFKIGVIVGLIMVVGIIVWLSTRDSLSPQARRAQKHQIRLQEQMRNKVGKPSPAQTTSENPSGPLQSLSPGNLPSAQPDAPPEPATASTELPSQPRPQESKQPDVERPKIKTTKFHIVRSGETLSKISQLHYNTVQNWTKIQDANPDVIKDPHKLIPGMKLTIPD